jgi:hypothetical protein
MPSLKILSSRLRSLRGPRNPLHHYPRSYERPILSEHLICLCFSPTATNWTRNVDVRQLAEAIRVNSTLEDVSIGTIGIPGMAGDTEWAVEILSAL